MNLSQLYYFRKLAELQHYTRAAKELYISQPALSDAIKTLERELGLPLFQREGRNVCLTRYGREFNEYVVRALNELDKGVELMHEYTGKLAGVLDVGSVYTVAGNWLPAVIEAYREKYGTGVRFEIMQGLSAQLVAGLNEEKYDVVFAAQGGEHHPELCFEPVLSYRAVVGVNACHPFAKRESLRLEDLAGHEVVTYRKGTPIGSEVSDLLERYRIPARYEFDDEIAIGGMLSVRHDDVCALTIDTIGFKPFSNVVLIPLDESEVSADFHRVFMVYKKAEFKNRALESFIDFVTEFAERGL